MFNGTADQRAFDQGDGAIGTSPPAAIGNFQVSAAALDGYPGGVPFFILTGPFGTVGKWVYGIAWRVSSVWRITSMMSIHRRVAQEAVYAGGPNRMISWRWRSVMQPAAISFCQFIFSLARSVNTPIASSRGSLQEAAGIDDQEFRLFGGFHRGHPFVVEQFSHRPLNQPDSWGSPNEIR